MEFEWDEDKNRGNRLKHGVSFAVAIEAFDDPFELSEFDAYYEGEPRYWTMGAPNASVILFVVYTIRPVFEGHIVTRIISARPVTKAERRRYEQRAKHR